MHVRNHCNQCCEHEIALFNAGSGSFAALATRDTLHVEVFCVHNTWPLEYVPMPYKSLLRTCEFAGFSAWDGSSANPRGCTRKIHEGLLYFDNTWPPVHYRMQFNSLLRMHGFALFSAWVARPQSFAARQTFHARIVYLQNTWPPVHVRMHRNSLLQMRRFPYLLHGASRPQPLAESENTLCRNVVFQEYVAARTCSNALQFAAANV